LFGLRKTTPPPGVGARDVLFGDIPLPRLLGMVRPEVLRVEPWRTFQRARTAIESGDAKSGIQALRGILETPNTESRVILQTWHALRALGENPPEPVKKQLLGVVVEVGMPKGLDLLAAYADHRARYYNFGGSGVVWEQPNDAMNSSIDEVLEKGAAVVRKIGPWQGGRPAAPKVGYARINLLTPSGLHFGEGPMDLLSKDEMGGAVLESAMRLMQKLMETGGKGQAERPK
jgi:hypothetical protein